VCRDERRPKNVDSEDAKGDACALFCLCTVRPLDECEAGTDGESVNLNNSSMDMGLPSAALLNAVPLSPIRREESLGTR
jgi:hypothetical protein